MSKKRRTGKTRDAPSKQKRCDISWLCSVDTFNLLCCSGYTRLSDCPEVRMCAHVYADLISSMTIHLMQNTVEGDVRIKNGLSTKLDIEPNRLMTRKTFIYNLVWVMLLAGDGDQVTYPRFTTEGYLDNLEPFKPSLVGFTDVPGGYKIRYNGQTYDPDEVLHFVINPDPDRPWMGTGFRAVLRDVIRGLRQAGATKQALLESPAPSVIVKVDGLTEEFASVDGRKKLSEQFLDSSENGRPWFIPSEAFAVEQVKPLTLKDLALADNMELDKRTVAGIFGVPPFMVGVGDFKKDAYNNFITSKVMPMAQGIQQEFTRKLIIALEWYFKFNPRSLYAYDISELVTAGSEMVDRMAMRRNEWRDWLGMAPDNDMNELLALENYIPADRLGDQSKLKGGHDSGDEGSIESTGEEPIAKVSLNGAQIQSLLQIVQAVVAKQLEYDSAITLITSAFPFDKETAKEILGNPDKLVAVGGDNNAE